MPPRLTSVVYKPEKQLTAEFAENAEKNKELVLKPSLP